PPFHAADAKETLRQVLTEDAAPPRQLNPQVPGDLDRVCLKCLRKESRKRYAAAGDLADDLRRFLDGKPVRARYESFRERAVKWVRRHPARAAALAVGLIAAFALLGVWRGLEHQREEDRIARRVDELVSTEPARVPDLVDELVRSGGRANRNVRERWDQAVASAAERTRLAMALVRFDAAGADTPAARLLEDRLPTADPAELKLIREALQPRAAELRPRLVAGLEHSDPDRRLRYAAALAGYEPDAAELAAHWTGLAERLVAESPLDLPAWVSVFRPAAGQLRPPLEKLFKSPGREDEARAAAAVLVAFLERPADLLDLIELDADEVQFRYVAAKLLKRSEETRSELATRLTGKWEAPTESERDKKARVQAHYAALALRLDPDGPAWEHLLRPPARDFRLQSYLIHWLPSRGVPAGSVLRRCDGTVGLAALLLTLGSYNQQQLPPSLRAELMPRVIEYFCKDPDPGVHSAAEWLLRKWGYGTEVDQAKVAFADKPMPQERRWYVTPDGMTMAVFPDVVNHQADFFELGDDGKQEHVTRKVTLSPFAISVLKVERAKVIERLTGRAPGPPPWPGLSHSKAAQYCNALTVDEMGEDECCYEKRGGWWRLRPDYAKRAGYRLPTEFEWDYAVRFGTTTPRFYGNDPELFEEYGGLVDPRRRTAVSGSVYKPNWAGLFDSLVPPFEYCHRRLEFKGDSDQESIHGVAGLLEKQELWRSDTAHTWHAFNDSTAFTFRIVQSWPPKR
ncbi:MAG TPA: hypothetical protein VKE40_24920, partial [Gemmataceae bacterium]|nr:hypothetical protein [Gemmataceae bacterium]